MNSGWPRTHHVEQTGLKLAAIPLSLPPGCWHYTQVNYPYLKYFAFEVSKTFTDPFKLYRKSKYVKVTPEEKVIHT